VGLCLAAQPYFPRALRAAQKGLPPPTLKEQAASIAEQLQTLDKEEQKEQIATLTKTKAALQKRVETAADASKKRKAAEKKRQDAEAAKEKKRQDAEAKKAKAAAAKGEKKKK